MEDDKLKNRVLDIVKLFEMQPHPEGGFFRETFRAPLILSELPHGEPRNASTAIYFLLPADSFSAFHRVRSDEVWHHYDGEAVALHILHPDGGYAKTVLGHNFQTGERPQAVVPAGSWQAAEPLGCDFSLCGCTVAPGFDFADFELAKKAELAAQYPQHASLVSRLSRE